MSTSRDHVAPLPRGFIAVRILQATFSFTIFCLAIFILSKRKFPYVGTWDYGLQVVITTVAITMVGLMYIMLATYKIAKIYNYWAILGLELLFLGAWCNGLLYTFAISFKTSPGCINYWEERVQDFVEFCKDYTGDAIYMAAANSRWALRGFAAALWLLWIVSFVVMCVGIARHRKAGGHCKSVI